MTLLTPNTNPALYDRLIAELTAANKGPMARLLMAGRLDGFSILSVGPDTGAFDIPAGKFVAVIGADPASGGLLPDAFDLTSLIRLSAATSARVINAAKMQDMPYATAALTPVLDKANSLIVEAAYDNYRPWVDLLLRLAPHKHLAVFAPDRAPAGWRGAEAMKGTAGIH